MDWQEDVYRRFAAACLDNDIIAVRSLVTADFSATLPAGREIVLPLSRFMEDANRRRRPYSDYGQNIDLLHSAVTGNTLIAHYRIIVTYDGLLEAGYGVVLQRPKKPVRFAFTTVDIVTFSADHRISTYTLVCDRLAIINNMGIAG